MRKNCSSDQEKLLQFETEGRESSNFFKLQAFILEFQKFSSVTRTIFSIIGQNNFVNKIPIFFFTETESGELKLPTDELLEQPSKLNKSKKFSLLRNFSDLFSLLGCSSSSSVGNFSSPDSISVKKIGILLTTLRKKIVLVIRRNF